MSIFLEIFFFESCGITSISHTHILANGLNEFGSLGRGNFEQQFFN